MDKDIETYQIIKDLYKNLTYFDQYGGSLIVFIIINIIVFLIVSYCYVMINAQPIINDWPNQRCKPSIMPFAGLINSPEGVSISDYTQENFTYCTQNILSSISGDAVQPLTFITSSLSSIATDVENSIQDIRAMFDKVRTMFQSISQEIMGRIMNIMIPLQEIIISFRDLIGKVQGSMTAGLFTLLGSYYTFKSLLGAIAQFIVVILIALAVMIAILWIVPFTWGAAASTSAIFVAISIPMAVMLAFMTDVLKIQTNLTIPKLKCFDKNTFIKMNDGTITKIINIKIGDILHDGNQVTAKIKVETKGSQMYKLDDIIVSDTHIVKYKNEWMRISSHPDAIKYSNYNQPYLYCLNTTNKIIQIKNHLFADWDEVYNNDINILKQNSIININNSTDIHTYLDGGFEKSTKIKLQNNLYKNIQDIKIGDILENGENVYGLVVINGTNVHNQFKYTLGKNTFIGGPNLLLFENNTKVSTLSLDSCKKQIINKHHKKLYHLLTDTTFFTINNITFCDYNANIDFFLESKKNYYL